MPVEGPMTSRTSNRYEDTELPRNTVQEVAPVGLYAVKYTDGYGKSHTRLVTIVNDHPFLLAPEISDNARAGQKWFKEQIDEKLFLTPPKKKARRKPKNGKMKTAAPEPKEKKSDLRPLDLETI